MITKPAPPHHSQSQTEPSEISIDEAIDHLPPDGKDTLARVRDAFADLVTHIAEDRARADAGRPEEAA